MCVNCFLKDMKETVKGGYLWRGHMGASGGGERKFTFHLDHSA